MLYRYTYPQKLTYNKPASILDWTVTYELYDPLFAYFSSVNDIVLYTLTNKSKDFTILYRQFVSFDQTTRKLTFKLAPMTPSASDGCEFNISLDLDCTINTDQENILLNHYEDNNISLYNKSLIPGQGDEIIFYDYLYQSGTEVSSKLCLSSTNRCDNDSWVEKLELPYKQKNETIQTIKPGTAPSFSFKLADFRTPGYYRVTRTNYSLKFDIKNNGSWLNYKTLSRSFFKQNLIPYKILAAFQGPGGGGSKYYDASKMYISAGGASGAFCIFVIDFAALSSSEVYFKVGKGGVYKPTSREEANTEPTALYLGDNELLMLVSANGGQGSYTSDFLWAGKGGAVEIGMVSRAITILTNLSGIDATTWWDSSGTSSSSGPGCSALGKRYSTLYQLLRSIPESIFYFIDSDIDVTKSEHKGGICHPHYGGGGGSASYFADGGDGGTGAGGSTGTKPGKYGSGGGGQGRTLTAGDGSGGDGFAIFFY